jgi:hypothetical protein
MGDEVTPEQVVDVGDVARDEIVHAYHGPPLGQKVLAQVGADEPGGASDESPRHQ